MYFFFLLLPYISLNMYLNSTYIESSKYGKDTICAKEFSNSNGTVVFFINTECPICLFQIDEIYNICQYAALNKMPVFLIFSDYEKAIGIRKFIKKYKLKNTICKKNKYLKYSNCLHARVAPQAFLLDKNGHTLYSGKIDDRIQVLGKKNFNIQAHYLLDNLNAFIHHQTLPFCDNEPLGCLIEY